MNEQPRRPTLSLNRNSNQPPAGNRKPQQQVQPKPKKEPKPPKPPKEPKPPKVPYALQMLGHDEFVKNCIDNQKSISIMLLSGCEFSGIVVSGDRYAMTILVDDIPTTFFKHAIEYYFPTQTDEQE